MKNHRIAILSIVFFCIIPSLSCDAGNTSHSPEINAERSTEEASYLPNQQAELSGNQTKSEAMQALKEEILKLGGSKADEAQVLLDEWWGTMVSGKQLISLPEATAANIQKHAKMLYAVDCFYFVEELNGVDVILPCEYLCYEYYRFYPNSPVQNYYPVEYVEEDSIVVLPESTVQNVARDVFGLTDYNLVKYYSARKETFPNSNSSEYKEEQLKQYPAYQKYIDREDVYCYLAWDEDPPAFKVKSSAYLEDGMYYVILEEGWWYDNEEPTLLDDMHIVIKETNTFFGFEVAAMLQNSDGSLLKPEWEPPC